MFYGFYYTEETLKENTLTSSLKIGVYDSLEERNKIAEICNQDRKIMLIEFSDEICSMFNLKTKEDCKRKFIEEWKNTTENACKKITRGFKTFEEINYLETTEIRPIIRPSSFTPIAHGILSMNPAERHPFMDNLIQLEKDNTSHLGILDIDYLMNWEDKKK
jgi:hypothetical protein